MGFFLACCFAALVYLPFGLIANHILQKKIKTKGKENVTWRESLPPLILLLLGIYLAIQGFQFAMGGVANSLNPY